MPKSNKWIHRKVYGSTSRNESEVSTELNLMSGKEAVYLSKIVEPFQIANKFHADDLKVFESTTKCPIK